MTVFAAHMVVYFSTQLFTATLARMASTARCVRRTWRHSWRRRRSRLTPGLCYWTTTARATRTSAPPCTRGDRRRTALSLSPSWHGWERCFCLCQTAGEFMSVQSTHITKDWNTIAFLIVGKTAVWGIFHVTVISICRKMRLSSPIHPSVHLYAVSFVVLPLGGANDWLFKILHRGYKKGLLEEFNALVNVPLIGIRCQSNSNLPANNKPKEFEMGHIFHFTL